MTVLLVVVMMVIVMFLHILNCASVYVLEGMCSLDILFHEFAVELRAQRVIDELLILLLIWLRPCTVLEHHIIIPPPLHLYVQNTFSNEGHQLTCVAATMPQPLTFKSPF